GETSSFSIKAFMSGLGRESTASLRISAKLLLSRKNGKPRTGSCKPSDGVACATNSMEAACAEVRSAEPPTRHDRITPAEISFLMPVIVTDALALRFRWGQMVNGGLKRLQKRQIG